MSNPHNQSTKMVGGVGKISDSDAELKHELSKTKAKFKRHVTSINWHNRKMTNETHQIEPFYKLLFQARRTQAAAPQLFLEQSHCDHSVNRQNMV